MSDSERKIRKEIFVTGKNVAIVTNTLYGAWYNGEPKDDGDTSKIRGDIALKTIKNSVNRGHPIVLADGGSSVDFLNEAKKLGAFVVDSSLNPGRAPQRRDAFIKGSQLEGINTLFYIQAEKVGIIDPIDHSPELSLPILEGKADIVVPAREGQFFEASYPDYMYRSEINVNKTYNDVLHSVGFMPNDLKLDWFFGPVLFRKDLLPLFLEKYQFVDAKKRTKTRSKVDPEMHSDAHYFPIIKALYQGLRVVSVQIPFAYPEEQKKNEMSEEAKQNFTQRRNQDAFTYRDEMIHFVRYLLKDPKSKIKKIEN